MHPNIFNNTGFHAPQVPSGDREVKHESVGPEHGIDPPLGYPVGPGGAERPDSFHQSTGSRQPNLFGASQDRNSRGNPFQGMTTGRGLGNLLGYAVAGSLAGLGSGAALNLFQMANNLGNLVNCMGNVMPMMDMPMMSMPMVGMPMMGPSPLAEALATISPLGGLNQFGGLMNPLGGLMNPLGGLNQLGGQNPFAASNPLSGIIELSAANHDMQAAMQENLGNFKGAAHHLERSAKRHFFAGNFAGAAMDLQRAGYERMATGNAGKAMRNFLKASLLGGGNTIGY